ncbi:MAG: molybdopterin dinucleotide binding domain-containing protein [Nitrospirota bacterium]
MMKTQNIPVLMEIYPENTATIHSKEAEKLKIKEGDYVWVESKTERLR